MVSVLDLFGLGPYEPDDTLFGDVDGEAAGLDDDLADAVMLFPPTDTLAGEDDSLFGDEGDDGVHRPAGCQ
ncbi:MAG: hypothetical protein AB7P02_05150 [Alphaproteobacteria bacterium]